MTPSQAKNLQTGDKVTFLGDRLATVLRVQKNGVWISYEGRGWNAGKTRTTRAPAIHLINGWGQQ